MKKICIDPGHGGHDPGATGNGLQEKDICLTLSLMLRDRLLKKYECEVIMTRETDKLIPLPDRAFMANARDADLFISLHVNGHDNAAANGYEDFIHPNTRQATADIRRSIHSLVSQVWADAGRANRGMKTANFQVLRETRMPAVLLEHGFISNAKDAELLRSTNFLEKLVVAMAEGIASELKLEMKDAGPFLDIPADHWAAGPITWAVENKLLSGFPDGTFKPDEPVTRAQLAVVMHRMMNK